MVWVELAVALLWSVAWPQAVHPTTHISSKWLAYSALVANR